jgi:hypothetical protein
LRNALRVAILAAGGDSGKKTTISDESTEQKVETSTSARINISKYIFSFHLIQYRNCLTI